MYICGVRIVNVMCLCIYICMDVTLFVRGVFCVYVVYACHVHIVYVVCSYNVHIVHN